MFIRERPKTPFKKFVGSADKIINDLVKMGKKGLKENEAKLASIIDNLSKNHVKIPEKILHPKGTEKNVHVHVKRIPHVDIKPHDKWQIAEGGLSFSVTDTKLIFAFFMSSFHLKKNNPIYMKLTMSNRELPESRQVSAVKIGEMSGCFAEVYYPDQRPVGLNIEHKTSTGGKIEDQGEDNYTMGALTMPVGSVFKHVNSQPMNFSKTKDWIAIPNFEMNVNFKDKKDYYFIVFYNFSLKLQEKKSFSTRLVIDNKPFAVINSC